MLFDICQMLNEINRGFGGWFFEMGGFGVVCADPGQRPGLNRVGEGV